MNNKNLTLKQMAILLDMEIAAQFYEGEDLVKQCREIILSYKEEEQQEQTV